MAVQCLRGENFTIFTLAICCANPTTQEEPRKGKFPISVTPMQVLPAVGLTILVCNLHSNTYDTRAKQDVA